MNDGSQKSHKKTIHTKGVEFTKRLERLPIDPAIALPIVETLWGQELKHRLANYAPATVVNAAAIYRSKIRTMQHPLKDEILKRVKSPLFARQACAAAARPERARKRAALRADDLIRHRKKILAVLCARLPDLSHSVDVHTNKLDERAAFEMLFVLHVLTGRSIPILCCQLNARGTVNSKYMRVGNTQFRPLAEVKRVFNAWTILQSSHSGRQWAKMTPKLLYRAIGCSPTSHQHGLRLYEVGKTLMDGLGIEAIDEGRVMRFYSFCVSELK